MSAQSVDKRDGHYSIRPDGFGRYEVLWSDGTVRLGYLNKYDAEVAADYFRGCDKESGFDGTGAAK